MWAIGMASPADIFLKRQNVVSGPATWKSRIYNWHGPADHYPMAIDVNGYWLTSQIL
jgi:hypothetical protein